MENKVKLKKIVRLLQLELEKNNAILDSLAEGYYVVDKNWRYTYVNQKACELAQKTKEEMIGKTVQELFPDAHELLFGKISQQVMKDRRQQITEAYYPRYNKWYENTIYPVSDNGIAILARDVTDRKTTENNLTFLAQVSKILSSSLDYQTTLNTVASLAVTYMADWCSVDMLNDRGKLVNVAIAHKDVKKVKWAKQYQKENPVDMNALSGLPNVLRSGKSELYPLITDEMLRQGNPTKKILKVVRKLGFTSALLVPIFSQRITCGVITFVISETKRQYTSSDLKIAEELASRASLAIENARLYASVQASTERLRLALEAGSIGVWEWDIQENTIIWSPQVYEFYGASPDTFDVTYENFSKQLYPEDIERAEKAIKKAVDGTQEYDITYRIVTLSGAIRWIASRAIVTRDAKGKPLRMLGATSDVTEQKKLEQEKNEFVSIATHELKTPVTSLKAYAEVLQKKFGKAGDTLSAMQMGKMNAQLDKLTSLIADLLDATKIESGRLQMHEEIFDFDELVKENVEELQRTTERHTLEIEGATGKRVTADRERTGQVLTNLISNAIKYSPHTTKILIQLHGGLHEITVCVRDYGIGIPKLQQSQLFERFYRVSGPKENTYPGLGLGLYIASEIVKRQQGRIWVESALGKGSSFCFTLPLKGRR